MGSARHQNAADIPPQDARWSNKSLADSHPSFVGKGQAQYRTHRKRRLIIILAVAMLAVVALAVGLGVGLTQGLPHHWSTTASSTSSATPVPATPYPSPTSTSGLWQPAVNSSWQIVLNNPLSLTTSDKTVTPDVDVYDIDMFGNSNDTIQALHQLGKKVICYISAGTYEPNRPDSSQFQSSDMGKELSGWPGEYWLDLKSTNVRNIMAARIALAAGKGCDALDPDNVDGYNNDNGLGLTQQDSVDFLQFLAAQTSHYNFSIGLKNAGELVPSVLDQMQFSVNEQCVQYSECATWAPFIQASKPVFHIEYPSGAGGSLSSDDIAKYCGDSGAAAGSTGFSTVLKNMDLSGWVELCNTTVATTSASS